MRTVELGSFAGAGRALGVSSSAVSKSVFRLEGRLGLRLLQRTTRSLGLTEEGRLLFDKCARALEDLEEAETAIREHAASPTGLLKVEFPVGLGRLKIAPFLQAFAHQYPGLQVQASFSDELTDLITLGLDAVVRIGEPRDSRLMVRRVGMVRYIVCAAPSYLAKHGCPRSPEDLDRFDCVMRIPRGGGPQAVWKFQEPQTGQSFERDIIGKLAFDSNDVILDAGLSGDGLVQLHTYMAEPHLRTGALVQVLKDYAVAGPPISILYPSNRHLAPKVRVFIDFVAAILRRE